MSEKFLFILIVTFLIQNISGALIEEAFKNVSPHLNEFSEKMQTGIAQLQKAIEDMKIYTEGLANINIGDPEFQDNIYCNNAKSELKLLAKNFGEVVRLKYQGFIYTITCINMKNISDIATCITSGLKDTEKMLKPTMDICIEQQKDLKELAPKCGSYKNSHTDSNFKNVMKEFEPRVSEIRKFIFLTINELSEELKSAFSKLKQVVILFNNSKGVNVITVPPVPTVEDEVKDPIKKIDRVKCMNGLIDLKSLSSIFAEIATYYVLIDIYPEECVQVGDKRACINLLLDLLINRVSNIRSIFDMELSNANDLCGMYDLF